ncbi:MAG: YceI family protein [Alphaproteobacteria bacterium]|nr:YceI family protein [Alphaproteobacteria bacterium]MBL7098578.1 YceI family protein [Alphaproteobacteria bacterium]
MRCLFALAFCLIAGAAQAAGVSIDPKQAPAGAYAVESRHTMVIFAIPHFGITDYYGRFEKVSGTLTFNPTAPEKSAVDIKIDMASANVMNSALVTELAGPSVFNTRDFPEATFTSTKVERTGPNTGRMTGDLTLRGVTKPVTFDVTFNGGLANPMGGNGYDLGFHATAVIKRSDFGMTAMDWTNFVGDDVKLTIEAMFVQQKT